MIMLQTYLLSISHHYQALLQQPWHWAVSGALIALTMTALIYYGKYFGLGWAMAGCPGAQYNLIGHGSMPVFAVLASAILGTFIYGLLRNRLPH